MLFFPDKYELTHQAIYNSYEAEFTMRKAGPEPVPEQLQKYTGCFLSVLRIRDPVPF
jgi:hypothetical protein